MSRESELAAALHIQRGPSHWKRTDKLGRPDHCPEQAAAILAALPRDFVCAHGPDPATYWCMGCLTYINGPGPFLDHLEDCEHHPLAWKLREARAAACAHDPETIATGEAMARLIEATKDEAGIVILHVPAGKRPDGRVIADEEGWTIERWPSVWGKDLSHGPTLPEAIAAALDAGSAERGSE